MILKRTILYNGYFTCFYAEFLFTITCGELWWNIKLEFIKFTSHAKQAALIQALPTPYSKEIPALYSIADEMLHYHIKSVDSQVEIQRWDGWACNPVLGCMVLSVTTVWLTLRALPPVERISLPSSQEMLAQLTLFYPIMHIHALANKPSMLKSATQTWAQGVRSMLTTGGENSPCDGTDVTCRHDVLMILPQEERKKGRYSSNITHNMHSCSCFYYFF